MFVKGRVDRRDETPRIMAIDLSVPDLTTAGMPKPITLTVPVARCTPPLVESLKEVLTRHPGDTEVHVRLQNGSRVTRLRLNGIRVETSTALMADLKTVLGAANVA